jgi:hypothetical protein
MSLVVAVPGAVSATAAVLAAFNANGDVGNGGVAGGGAGSPGNGGDGVVSAVMEAAAPARVLVPHQTAATAPTATTAPLIPPSKGAASVFVTNGLNSTPDMSPGPYSDRRRRVLVLGAGRIGRCIAAILGTQNRYVVTLADQSSSALDDGTMVDDVNRAILDVHQEARMIEVLRDQDAVVSACSYAENPP